MLFADWLKGKKVEAGEAPQEVSTCCLCVTDPAAGDQGQGPDHVDPRAGALWTLNHLMDEVDSCNYVFFKRKCEYNLLTPLCSSESFCVSSFLHALSSDADSSQQ